jgi:hypothetical protein
VKKGTQGIASVEIRTQPVILYDAVSDVRRMGDWSPECRCCEWLGEWTQPVVGALFKGKNQHGLFRWSTKCTVVVADPGREFAFVTSHLGQDATRWSYRFEVSSHHTTVWETFEMLHDMPWHLRFADRHLMRLKDRKVDLEANMQKTLQELKASMEGLVLS